MTNWTFDNHAIRLDSPATQAVEITPSDTEDLDNPVRALYIGGDGALKVTPLESNTPVILPGLVAGIILPIVVKKVWADSTTATGIVGLL